jgi:hypothetical protein
VPPDWLVRQLDEAARGAHAVLGTVQPEAGLPYPIERAWSRRHLQRDDHPHVHGANLGIRADVLHALGGWPDVMSGEDVTLVARARHLRIVRTAQIPVRTSSRLSSRTRDGFAAYLRDLAHAVGS